MESGPFRRTRRGNKRKNKQINIKQRTHTKKVILFSNNASTPTKAMPSIHSDTLFTVNKVMQEWYKCFWLLVMSCKSVASRTGESESCINHTELTPDEAHSNYTSLPAARWITSPSQDWFTLTRAYFGVNFLCFFWFAYLVRWQGAAQSYAFFPPFFPTLPTL